VGTIVPVARTFDWVLDLDLRGQLLRDTVWELDRLSRRYHVLSYTTLRRLLDEELQSLREQKPTGFVSALWAAQRRGFLPVLVAGCDRVIASGGKERYISLLGFDRLRFARCSSRSLEAVLAITEDAEVRRRFERAFR
jgi:hypothetical protein